MDKKPTFNLFGLVYLLLAIGLAFISVASLSQAQSTFADKYFFIKKQLLWVGLGTASLVFFSKINLNFFKKNATFFYLAGLGLLALVLVPGFSTTIFGAKRWLSFGGFVLQPTEVFKMAAAFYFSYLFSQPSKRTLKNTLLALAPAIILILLEPNMSTVILIIAIIFSLYYVAGGEIMPLFSVTLIGVILGIILIVASPYRNARLQTLLNSADSQNSYHANQIIIGLSSGGLFGKGFANSSQKYQFLPQLATDSILAVIGEEMGFIGVMSILFVYYLLITTMIKIGQTTDDSFRQLLVFTIAFWIAYQTLINCAAIAVLIPLTGIPLPFISYGGSSLLVLLSAVGLVRNVETSARRKK